MLSCKQVTKVSSGNTGGQSVFRGQRKAAFLLFILAMVFSMAGAALGDLEAHWEFDESSGSSASDSEGSNTGTLNNMSDGDWVSGYLNNALDFDGSNDYVNVSDSDSISVGNGDFTLSMWVYPHSVSGDYCIISKVNGSYHKEYMITLYDQEIQFDIERTGNNGAANTNNVMSANEWQQILVTYDVSTENVAIYVDGESKTLASNTIGGPSTGQSDDLCIGRRGGSYNDNYFDGLIDDVKIYDSLEPPPQPTIYNTGVDNNGDALGDEVEDPHWTLTTSADPSYDGPETYTVDSDDWPLPDVWMANTSDSMWICPRQDATQIEDGAYVYELEFDLTGYDPDTAEIDGKFASDDSVSNVKLNGVSKNITGSGFGDWDDCDITSSFQSGTNTLEFFVTNGGSSANPGGFRAELTVTANPMPGPSPATSPSPANSATSVSVTADLSWTAGSGTITHDVYFGVDSTPDSTEYIGNQGTNIYDPGTMEVSTTYYWRIDEVNGNGTTTGTVWSFTTAMQVPDAATNPSPANSATNVTTTTDLSWTAGDGAASHDVYFGQDSTPDSGEFQGNQGGVTYDTGTMSNNTTYYWRIDEVNAAGTTAGSVWSFTTVVAAPGAATSPSLRRPVRSGALQRLRRPYRQRVRVLPMALLVSQSLQT